MASPVTTSKCAEPSCRNRVKSTNPSYPYCHHHQRERVIDYGSDYANESRQKIWTTLPKTVMPRVNDGDGFSEHRAGFISSLYVSFLGMKRERSESLVNGIIEWKQGDDLTVPDIAEDRIEDSVIGLRDALRSNGVPIHSMNRVRLSGLHRGIYHFGRGENHGWKRNYDEDAYREVLVLDYSNSNPIAVDPIIAAYAPVADRSSSVSGTFEDGETPFTDEIWVEKFDNYVRNPYISWDSHEKIEWHER